MSDRQNDANILLPQKAASFSLNLSRRDLFLKAGKGVMGLTALSLLIGGGQSPVRAAGIAPRGKGLFVKANDTAQDPALQQLPLWSDGTGWNQPQYYETIQLADIDGDGRNELIIRGPHGITVEHFEGGADHGQWVPLITPDLAWSDENHWNQPQYYKTIQCADIDGDGRAEILARGPGGIVGYKYNGSDPANPKLDLIPTTGSDALSDAGGWSAPEYYSTIHFGDVDGDGSDELICRGYLDILIWKFFGDHWDVITRGPKWGDDPNSSSDGTQWNLPQYYETITSADVDGDGAAEVIGRSKNGIEVWKYSPSTGNWSYTQGPTSWTDSGGYDQASYYTTLRHADIDGDGQEELMLRDADSLDIWKYDKQSGKWYSYSYNPELPDSAGWYLPQYRDTLRLGDIDGDGRAELIARYSSGVRVWKFINGNYQELPLGPRWTNDGTDGNGNSQPDSNGTSWDQVEYYSTLRLADIDNDGAMELIARDKYAVQTWKYDKTTQGWNRTSATFPDYTSSTVSTSIRNAYTYINVQLRGDNPPNEFRTVYYTLTASLQNFHDALSKLPPPSTNTSTAADWAMVKNQILRELNSAINVNAWYGVTHEVIHDTFLSDSVSLTTVGSAQLNIPANNGTAKTVLSVLSTLTTVAKTISAIGGPATATYTAAAGVLGTVFTLASSRLTNNGASYQEAYNQLPGKLNEAFQESLAANATLEEQAMKDYGLLSATSTLVQSGVWSVSDTQSTTMVTVGQRSYEISLYQMLTPIAWRAVGDDVTTPSGYGPYMPQQYNVNYKKNTAFYMATPGIRMLPSSVALSTLKHLFDQPTTATPNAGDPLGQSVHDAINGTNGWSIPLVLGYPLNGLSYPLNSRTWTPEPDLLLQVTPVRDAVTNQVVVKLTVENGGFGPATPVTNVEVLSARLGQANALTALPMRPTRLGENRTHQLTLNFPGSVGIAGKTVVLQIQGKYKGGTFGGSFRVKLP